MKVSVTFEVSEATTKLVIHNAIERVINTSIEVLNECESGDDEQDSMIERNIEDWEMSKATVCQLWGALRDAVFRKNNDDMPQVRDWVI